MNVIVSKSSARVIPWPLPKPWDSLGSALLIVLVAVLSYLPAFPAGFVFDDHSLITSNGLLRGPLWKVWLNATATDYWPLTWTSFWLEWRLWGPNAAGYHILNVVLHAVVALLLWRVLQALQVPGAWLSGLLFAVHPVTVESVAWISERKNTLSGIFYLSAILVWVSGDEAMTFRRRLLSLVLFTAALLAKVSVVMLPPVLLLIALFRKGKLELRDWIQSAPFFALGLIAGLVNIWFQWQNAMGGSWTAARTWGERVGGAGWALASYLEAAFVPLRLAFVYPEWPVGPDSLLYYLPTACVLTAFGLLWANRNRVTWVRGPLYALTYHALLLLPVLGFIDMAYSFVGPVSNHLQYLALMGPVALVGAWLTILVRRWPKPAGAGAAALVLVLGAFTFHRASAFETDLTLWDAAVRQAPTSTYARAQRSSELLSEGRSREALDDLDAAARFARTPADRHRYRAMWFLYGGRNPEAAAEARLALRAEGTSEIRRDMAFVLAASGQAAEAIELYRAMVRESPNSPKLNYWLAVTLARSGQVTEAAEVLRAYSRRRPGDPTMEKALGLTLLRLGLSGEALEHAAAAVGAAPSDPRAAEELEAWKREMIRPGGGRRDDGGTP
jgi:tetratricopeptide (TPR) repeat protein